MERVNLAEKSASFGELWQPHIVGEVDDFAVKIVKLEGDFVWHSHADADELFLVVDGALRMDFRDRQVAIGPGEFIVVPKGVEHKPFAESECQVVLLERRDVLNTGDAESDYTVREPKRI